MTQKETRKLEEQHFIRHMLYRGRKSAIVRYKELVLGNVSTWQLIKYELITLLFGSISGALGLTLRSVFFRYLFREVGHGVLFGRNLVIRHPDKTSGAHGSGPATSTITASPPADS